LMQPVERAFETFYQMAKIKLMLSSW
jgi:hypothetical protein